ncbi:MAG: ABC transporter substrate-binding protein [Peptococcaceae bacterium]
MKKIIIMAFSIMLILNIAGCADDTQLAEKANTAGITFTDDSGKVVQMDEPAQRIISLYSAHTENLFSLGLNEEIIGVYKSDAYPPQVRGKQIFDYRSDPEKVIAAEPDLVLIRPFIKNSSPEFVDALEKAGINVVSLYPEKYEDFQPYLEKLALLTGKEEEGAQLLDKFYSELAEIQQAVRDIRPKAGVYFEATETNYRTITPDSIPAHAINFAGGVNIASDAEPLREGTSIAAYGAERILEKAEEIDIYVAQSGAMNSGGNPEAIRNRPGFSAIKAVRDNKIYNIDEKLVSSPTFRFAKGVKELSRMFYPRIWDDLSKYNNADSITRAQMAEITVLFKHQPIFSPTAKHYESSAGHVYGTFKDVLTTQPGFDYIETAVLSGFINDFGDEFRPDENITRENLAEILLLLTGPADSPTKVVVKDLNKCRAPQKVQLVIDNGLLNVEDGLFNPEKLVTGQEVIQALQKITNKF